MIRPVVGHIIRQLRPQLVRHSIANVIVGAVLPAAGLACRIVRVLDLLLELGLLGQFVVQKDRTICITECQTLEIDDFAVCFDLEAGIACEFVVSCYVPFRILRNYRFLQRIGLSYL